MLTDKALEILTTDRKLDAELLVKLGIESHAQAGTREWISIPYFVGAETINHKYRTISGEKDFRQDTDAKKCFWNINALMDSSLADNPIIITEGEMDCIAAIQSGFPRSVSVPDGAPKEQIGDKETKKYSYLDDALKLLANERQIILALDNDNPGINLMNDLALRLGKSRCKWIKYPEGCKDLNDVLKLHGEDGIRSCIAKADWIKSDGVYLMSQLPPIVEKPLHYLGIKPLDDFYRVRTGDFVVVTGIPSHGKSTLLNEIACRLASVYGWRTAFCSFEQQPQTDHKKNLRAWFLRKDKFESEEELTKADKWIDDYFRFIVPSDDDLPNLDWMLEKICMSVTQHDCKCVIIDPWNEMDHTRPKEMMLTEYTGYAIKQFKRLAKMLDIHLVVAAHPAKMKKEDGKFMPPTLYDISDSAHWANKADVGICVFRPSLEQNETHIIVNKIRYQPTIGTPGVMKAHYVASMKRYEEMVS